MNAAEFNAALAKVGLSQRGAATFLGYNERTVRRWALDELPIPLIVDRHLRLMLALKLSHAGVLDLLSPDPTKGRR